MRGNLLKKTKHYDCLCKSVKFLGVFTIYYPKTFTIYKFVRSKSYFNNIHNLKVGLKYDGEIRYSTYLTYSG